MSISSGFARESRFAEVDGCPLGPDGENENACSRCPFNALNPGRSRVGCVLHTSFEAYTRAMTRLEKISRADYDRLERVIEEQRRTDGQTGLSPDDLTLMQDIASRWWPLVSNDPNERDVVSALLRFSEAGMRSGEPVRILL